MPSLFGRFRFGRNASVGPPSTSTTDDTRGSARARNTEQKRPTKSVSPSSGLRSWFSLKRSRSERDANQPSGRPPTPTPHLALASSSSKDSKTRTLKRVRPPNVDSRDASNEREKGKIKETKEESDSSEEDHEENGLTEQERAHLAYYANGVRGLMAQLKLAEKESRFTPPMTNEDGTPLSPISEADEHGFEAELETQRGLVQWTEIRVPSLDEVTDLDYGELLDPAQFDQGDEDEHLIPRWNPDVIDLFEAEVIAHHRSSLPVTPSASESDVLNDTVEPGHDQEENFSEDKAQADTEGEDDQDYFSAQSVPASGDEDDRMTPDETSRPGLRLRGLLLASSSSETLSSDSSSGHQNTEDYNSRTPRPSPQRNLLTQSHPIFRPDRIDGPTSPTVHRHRATTLPIGRDRILPSLPRLTIPGARGDNANESSSSHGELLHTVAQLEREKARLEQALESASKKIEQQDGYIASLEAQIAKLHAALVRFARGETQPHSEVASSQPAIPIIVRAAQNTLDAESGERTTAEVEPVTNTGLMTPSSATAIKGGVLLLSTPPATPDRRAVAALSEASSSSDENRNDDDTDRQQTPKATRRLVRRKSTEHPSAMGDLGLGRIQVKRRAGSEDLKTLTQSVPWP